MQNTSKVEKFNLSGALLFGIINDAKDLLLHHLLLIARHYIYTCKQRDTRPNVQMYIQIVQRTVEVERQIAKDQISLDTFKRNGLDEKPPLFKRMYYSVEVNYGKRSVDDLDEKI